ncbi:hypothetical protein M9Y10_021145 [Tritrichomonas musculus]|uniref:Uncharacterized protein n=1 Tax=Tritrichomonas musculus TaxID=1915356 RepID=A0ABR2HD50_9EUKA
MPRKRISQEQLIGVTCGSASVFFLILEIIILVVRKRRENIEQSEDFIDFSSDKGEIYIKDGEANIYENEFANGFPQD